jgi:transposase
MAQYSNEFRSRILRKVLPPENRSIAEVSKEEQVSVQTITKWIKQLEHGKVEPATGEISPASRSTSEKITLLLESKSIAKDDLGRWLRENGLHSEHLTVWEQELRETMDTRQSQQQKELKDLKKANKQLQKELNRKEKALAEFAALLALKKKVQDIWGDGEDD